MKLIDKLAEEFWREHTDYDHSLPRETGFKAGFRKAREMCQKHANWVSEQEIKQSRDGLIPSQIAAAFAYMGESEVE